MKKDLYLDFDSTIVNSDKAIAAIYNETYKNHPHFVAADWTQHSNWAYACICPLIHQLEENPIQVVKDYFGSEAFFNQLEFYDHAKRVIQALSEKYRLIICTSAFPMNASKKVLWIEEHLPQVHEIIILIDQAGKGYGKARVSMLEEGAIFIDDHPKNLLSTQASQKILFKMHATDYNDNWQGQTVSSWLDIEALLL